MTLQDVINGPLGVSLVFSLAQSLPPRMGFWLAERLCDRYARLQNQPQVRVVQANQWVAAGGGLPASELKRIARAVFSANGRCLYHYYHNLKDDADTLACVDFDPAFRQCIERSQENRVGQLLVLPHMSNFDLTARAAVLSGMRMQVLSYALPPAGYRLQNRIRQLEGMQITPITNTSLRQALERLEGGGTVITGVDRPQAESVHRPVFFGRPSSLPTGYARLALRAGVPVIVVGIRTLPGDRYRVWASEPILMRGYENRDLEAVRNTEAVLEAIEPLIRQAPEQWSMFYPVWKDALNEIPL